MAIASLRLTHRAEHALDDVARRAERIPAECFLLLADHEVESVERLLRDVALDGGLILLDEAEGGALPGEGVVLLGEPDAGGGFLDDRQKTRGQLRLGRAPEALGGR